MDNENIYLVLDAIGEKLKAKETEINIKKYDVLILRERLEAAEKKIRELTEAEKRGDCNE